MTVVEMTWVPDRSWRLVSGRRCRMQGAGHASCPRPAVAELNRHRWQRGRKVDSWWAYCSHHLYGRRIADGEVQIQVPVTSPAAERGYVSL